MNNFFLISSRRFHLSRTARLAGLFLLAIASGLFSLAGSAYGQTTPITRQETLRGTITPEREWWDLLHYDLAVQFVPTTRSIKGSNVISFKALKAGRKMQIDLQEPLKITKVVHGVSELKYEREGNVYWVVFDKEISTGAEDKIQIFYEGNPKAAANPPWDGGVSWNRDD